MARLFLFLLFTSQVLAQPSGPVLRPLGHNYFLVQCNAVKLQADDNVTILRQGVPVGTGKVMRFDSEVCSVLLTSGEARRLDLVVLAQRNAAPGDRGPSLPTCGTIAPKAVPPALASKKAPTASYFGSINNLGGVYNLNTGEYLTRP